MNVNLTPEVITVGLSLVTSLIVAGSSLAVINHKVKSLEADSKDSKKEIKNISSKLDRLIGKVSVIFKDSLADTLSESNSPRQLSELGQKVLKDSSIRETLEPIFDNIVEMVKLKNPENPYQAQEALFEVVQSLKDDRGISSAIENGAFLSGHTPEEVLYVGALDIRDSVIKELGLRVGDIDKHDPSKSSK